MFEAVEINTRTNVIRLGWLRAHQGLHRRVCMSSNRQESPAWETYHPRQSIPKERDAYVIALKSVTSSIELTDRKTTSYLTPKRISTVS